MIGFRKSCLHRKGVKQSPRLQYRGACLHTLLFKKDVKLTNIDHTETGYSTSDARIALTEFQDVVLDYREVTFAILSMRLI